MQKTSKAKMIVGIVVGVIGAIIALQNLQPVETMILLWRFTMPHALLLVIMLGAGFVFGMTVALMPGAKYLHD